MVISRTESSRGFSGIRAPQSIEVDGMEAGVVGDPELPSYQKGCREPQATRDLPHRQRGFTLL